MDKILDIISEKLEDAFEKSGYERELGRVSCSNRPDLCEYQCNGAMAAAKKHGKPPLSIAEEVVAACDDDIFDDVRAVRPGFININISKDFACGYLKKMADDERLGYEKTSDPGTIIIDYGGANVAKPLHVGHLRSAVIGESIKRICRFAGNRVIGDVHLGDWGLQIGLIIEELKLRKPELVYFDADYDGDYPDDAPFTVSELEEIYPAANARSKEDEDFKNAAREAILELQQGRRGYVAIWSHIISVSVNDLKKNYDSLNVSFDLWGKESDAQSRIPGMIKRMKEGGFTRTSDGALVIDVKTDGDTKEIPPCMILKSDGATLYNTTDLATIEMRVEKYDPDAIIYVVDNRQELYFEQVFRAAKKTGLISRDAKLIFKGFGTMNGRDGKPFKTRDGGVMRLEYLLNEVSDAVYERIMENRTADAREAKETAKTIGLAALKYGDLSNQASKDYIFDVDKFTSFEGNTGPYILYTIVRIKSILEKYDALENAAGGIPEDAPDGAPGGVDRAEDAAAAPVTGNGSSAAEISADAGAENSPDSKADAGAEIEKSLILGLCRFNDVIDTSYRELAPHRICTYIYEISNTFNRFYHETKILSEPDGKKREEYIALITLTKRVLEQSIDLLGFEAPQRM